MITAIILSGQLRTFQDNYQSLKNNILDHNDCHIYMQTYIDTELSLLQRAIELYNPHKFLIEKPIKDFNVCANCEPTREAMFWMLRNAQATYKLIPTTYDCVVKARYDIEYETPIIFADYDMNNINIPSGSDWLGGINDLFAFSSHQNIGHYCSLFNNLDNYVNNDHIACHPETLLRHHLKDKPVHRFNFPLYLRGFRMTDCTGADWTG